MIKTIKMIPIRLAQLVAPWCLVWLIASGCSRQAPTVGEAEVEGPSKSEWQKLTGIQSSPRQTAVAGSLLERYDSIIGSKTDSVELRKALIQLYAEWGLTEGEAAVAHAMAHNRPLVRHAFTGWMQADPAAPRDWVLSQSASGRRQGTLATALLHALPVTDHGERGEWVANFAAHPSGARLVSEVAIAWARDRPQEALGWLADLPHGRSRSDGIETIFHRWTAADPAVASAHLTRMPSGSAKDLAISSLAKAIHQEDPEAAQLWAESITDDRLQELTLSLLNKLALASAAAVPEL